MDFEDDWFAVGEGLGLGGGVVAETDRNAVGDDDNKGTCTFVLGKLVLGNCVVLMLAVSSIILLIETNIE